MRTFSSSPARRVAALFSASTLAATALIATAGSAGAAITQGAESEDPALAGLPAYMFDAQGVALQLCLEACTEPAEPGGPAPEPADPAHAPYFVAEAAVGPFSVGYEVATEAEEAPEGGAAGDPQVVNAAGIRARGLTPNAIYTVKGPWGTLRVRASDRGRIQEERLGAVQSFLLPASFSGGEMIGDAHTFTTVTGSPTGFNRVTVTGPGVNQSTNRFALWGQLADDQAMSSVSATSLTMGNRNNTRPVVRNIRVRNFGTAPLSATWALSGANSGAFAVTDNCASVAEGGACTIRVTYTPRANRTATALLTIDDNTLANPARTVALNGTGPDTLRARVTSSSPAAGQTVGVKRNVSVRFDDAVRGVKKSSFQVTNLRSGNKVGGTVSRVGRTNRYVFNPRRDLARNTSYRVRLVGGRAAIRDLAGNALRTKTWKFRTR